ncbi:acyl-CoA dehydrogenase [Mycolicibacterium aromaticivorans JS19b1 = JCM 16368]|uniref:Acyl-CoA dehydrogenase n=1 Tax=Mycolicibacterium aromaticivorans JS19b1 = JCM 16368 TaxID=1440774 RepID=A0A064CTL3_9MYCO|nr:acyl-CoA dehydrogenase family protein [Mycolicibacterium aromaticivorans]KDF02059.1 acyl-CoA dehydrogenase [Mycolicibacterium aromaticivorans JS19b1 = JCM 16368]
MAAETSEFDEFHGELRSLAAELLAKDRAVAWPVLADAGWVGLEVAEHLGGAGATFAEVAVICEELGRAASTTSFLGSAVLAVGVLNALEPSEFRDRLLAEIASGDTRVAVAFEPFDFVPDAEGADTVLVVTDAGVTEATVSITPQPVLDETRRLARVAVERPGAALSFVDESAGRRLRDRAAVAIACDSLGVAEAMLTATVDYAKVRQQFGRPIGSFQAVKHACADMYVAISVSRQLVSAAVHAIALDQRDAAVKASMAKSYACSTAVDVAGKAMQLHGGIGYTWESGIHVYLKRAALNRSLFGSPASCRHELAQRYL